MSLNKRFIDERDRCFAMHENMSGTLVCSILYTSAAKKECGYFCPFYKTKEKFKADRVRAEEINKEKGIRYGKTV